MPTSSAALEVVLPLVFIRQFNPPLDLHVSIPSRKASAYAALPFTTRQNRNSFLNQFCDD
ncbi:MAG: hypothetical protein NDI91_15755 [Sulfuritalea sp.]|nr:hypothetical protein [Sulfuritalea sp.]